MDDNSGMSLGNFILTGKNPEASLLRHEYGHTIQSIFLGPFYLLVVGLPSLLWASIIKSAWALGYLNELDYDSFYVERSATELGEYYAAGLDVDVAEDS